MRLAVRESEALPDGPAPPPAAHPVPSSDPKVEKAAAVLTSALESYNRSSLRFVAYSLDLDMSGPDTKANHAAKLTAWVSLIESTRHSPSNVSLNAVPHKAPCQSPLCLSSH
jgi:hypothetical protein